MTQSEDRATSAAADDDPKEEFVMVEMKQAEETPKAAWNGPVQQPDVIMNWKNVLAYLGLLGCMFLAAIDNTIVATALPDITSEFKAADLYSWVIVAYLLTSTAVTPIVGRLAMIFGRKKLIMVSVVVFLISSAICGAAVDIYMLIIFRAVQGIGGGVILSGGMVLISDWFPINQRAKYGAFIGLCFSVANVVGPVVGGAFSLNVSWRWVFYINLPSGGLSLATIFFFLNYEADRANNASSVNASWNQAAGSSQQTITQKLRTLDYGGMVLILVAVTCLVLGVSLGGNQYPWRSAPVIVLLVACGPLFILLVWYEMKIAKNPVLSFEVFLRKAVSLSSLGIFLLGAVVTGLINYMPVYFQIIRGDNPIISGVKLIPILLFSIVPTVASGRVIGTYGYAYPWPIAGFVFTSLSGGLLTTISAGTSYPAIGFFLALIGIGLGCIIQVMFFVAQGHVEPKEIPMVSALVTFFRTLGGVAGVTIFQTIITNTLTSDLKDDFLVQSVNKGYDFIKTNLTVEQQDAVYTAYLHGMHLVFWAATAMSLLGLFIVVWIPRQRLPCEVTRREAEEKRKAAEGNGEKGGESDLEMKAETKGLKGDEE
ncbi:putative MFS toxin efflux pump (AflT) [Planoprotostelium fungivorum]|uniref:Putative MFS toxin efflux pump (AflT) n=1 Tax=Planoprotostelium fungivorum TaxID=1890364 RepID=A0A2P6N128_9EUKA|nr:putative MFS toxin efflux pump (AflT) [Planoprotostelium fungivorum]